MSNSQRRQMMQPWPLCLVPFSKTKERSVLPKYYTKVPSIARSSTTSSGIDLDCSSNSTLVTTASPFNSQTALIVEKKASPDGIGARSTNHYYAENLRNNHQKALSGSRIYNPLDRDLERDYKQLDPLLTPDHAPTNVSIKPAMTTQEMKPPKGAIDLERLTPSQFQKDTEPSPMRFARQISESPFDNVLTITLQNSYRDGLFDISILSNNRTFCQRQTLRRQSSTQKMYS